MEHDGPMEELLRKYRRDLHRIPETGYDLPKTIAYVRTVLAGLSSSVEVFSPCESTVCAFFDYGRERTCAIRADMDALPVTERTGAAYASTHAGRMHACGHDGHMAMVLGLARWLDTTRPNLPRNVLLVFQPAEETSGGARIVCESGVFDRYRADRIFGFHLWPSLPKGSVATRRGAFLAGSNETDVTFHGRASHIGRASEGNDALEAACRFLCRVYDYASEQAEQEPFLLKFGHVTGGQVRNQIAAEAKLEGSLRTFSMAMGERARSEILELAEACAQELGCTSTTSYSPGYPPVVNDDDLLSRVLRRMPEIGLLDEPLLISEDFAFYQQLLPSVFLLLGTGTGIPLHADTFDFDERVLTVGLGLYQQLVAMD